MRLQKLIELSFDKQLLLNDIKHWFKTELEPPDEDIEIINEWVSVNHYPSKNARINSIETFKDATSTYDWLNDLYASIACLTAPVTLQTIASELGMKLDCELSNKERTQTVCEILCLIGFENPAFTIDCNSPDGIVLINNIVVPADFQLRRLLVKKVPPMVIPPQPRIENHDSPYLIASLPALSGDADCCLEVANVASQVPFQIDIDSFAYPNILEEPEEPLTYSQLKDREENHIKKIEQTFKYLQMIPEDCPIYFPWFYDHRGRMYTDSYHLNPQGTDFEKSNLLFYRTEHVEYED